MRMLIQRVRSASVEADGRIVGSIDRGLLVFLAIHRDDTESLVPWMVRKTLELRIFPNDAGKADLHVQEIKGSLLIVSQFTLYADCRMGRRPDFLHAAPPFLAHSLYDFYVAECTRLLKGGRVETGLFGAPMSVSLINEGPCTILVDSPILLEEEKKEKKG